MFVMFLVLGMLIFIKEGFDEVVNWYGVVVEGVYLFGGSF